MTKSGLKYLLFKVIKIKWSLIFDFFSFFPIIFLYSYGDIAPSLGQGLKIQYHFLLKF